MAEIKLGEHRDFDLGAISLGHRMAEIRAEFDHAIIVEIHDNDLCIFPTNQNPIRLTVKDAKKILPQLVEYILKE